MKGHRGSMLLSRASWTVALRRGRGPIALALVLAQIVVVSLVYRARHPAHAAGRIAAWDAGADRARQEQALREIQEAYLDAVQGLGERYDDYLDEDARGVELDGKYLPPAPRGRFRPSDTPWGSRAAEELIGVEDLHAELQSMSLSWRGNATHSDEVAMERQHCLPASLRGSEPADDFVDRMGVSSIPFRLARIDELATMAASRYPSGSIGIVATTSADLKDLRRQLLPWMLYHAASGVSHFYLLYDGHDERVVRELSASRRVTLMHVHQPWASAREAKALEAALLANPGGNFRLMAVQSLGARRALELARADDVRWLAHVDPDELLYLEGAANSLPGYFASLPDSTPSIRFMNHEAQAEEVDVVNPYEQVTLFRTHKHFVTPEAHFHRSHFKLGDSPTFLLLYANGKSAIRTNAPGARPNGPHFWHGHSSPRWIAPDNPNGTFHVSVSDDLVVLHYAYTRVEDVIDKAKRSCPQHLEPPAATKGANAAGSKLAADASKTARDAVAATRDDPNKPPVPKHLLREATGGGAAAEGAHAAGDAAADAHAQTVAAAIAAAAVATDATLLSPPIPAAPAAAGADPRHDIKEARLRGGTSLRMGGSTRLDAGADPRVSIDGLSLADDAGKAAEVDRRGKEAERQAREARRESMTDALLGKMRGTMTNAGSLGAFVDEAMQLVEASKSAASHRRTVREAEKGDAAGERGQLAAVAAGGGSAGERGQLAAVAAGGGSAGERGQLAAVAAGGGSAGERRLLAAANPVTDGDAPRRLLAAAAAGGAAARRSLRAEALQAPEPYWVRPSDYGALKRDCFIIDVDRDAFIAARRGPEAARQFFMERMALCEGSRVRCVDAEGRPHAWCTIVDVDRYTHVMLKLGLYKRIRGPSIVLAEEERVIQRSIVSAARDPRSSERREEGDAWLASERDAPKLMALAQKKQIGGTR